MSGADPAAHDGAALLRLFQGLRRERTRHPLTATVLFEDAEGQSTSYRLEMWMDGRTARCIRSDDGFRVEYAPLDRTLRHVGGLDRADSTRRDADFPSRFIPLCMGAPLSLPIWGDEVGGERPLAVRGAGRHLVEVDYSTPEDGTELEFAGTAVIDTRLMCAASFTRLGGAERYTLLEPRRLTMPDWSSLLG